MRRQSSVNSRTVELLKENQSSWSHFTTADQYSIAKCRRARGFVLIAEPEAERRGLLLPAQLPVCRQQTTILAIPGTPRGSSWQGLRVAFAIAQGYS